METNTILNGDSLTQLKELPSESINCVMTSPPYWALRDYGTKGQLGLEPTFDEYINKLCDIFDEVKRVLRDNGTCWVNIGDTYFAKRTSDGEVNKINPNQKSGHPIKVIEQGIQSKSLVMIPFRFAIEMVNRGWILRNTIIWHKRNCMPSSVKDRFTVDFEYLFFFSKNKKYYFETQREPHKRPEFMKHNIKPRKNDSNKQYAKHSHGPADYHPDGRNKRTVWTINPKPFKEAHFAVYPEELCETPIKAGCPEFVCNKCGNLKIHNIEKEVIHNRINDREDANVRPDNYQRPPNNWKQREVLKDEWKPTCSCNAGFTGGIVLDPFFGAGTTGLVALKQNKKFIGIELNPEYIKIAEERLKPFLEQRKQNESP